MMEPKTTYKALDVREYLQMTGIRYHSSMGHGGYVDGDRQNKIVVICINLENNKRERLELYKGYMDYFLGNYHYYGYSGDYELLVPGDVFEIVNTDTYSRVSILEDVQ